MRTWFKLHKLIQDEPELGHSWVPIIAGTIGEGAAAEFKTFCGIWQSLPEGELASIIGEINEGSPHVILTTELGGERILEELEDDPLPRIC